MPKMTDVPKINTEDLACVGKDGRWTLACEIGELGWKRTPMFVDIESHKTGVTRKFMLLREVRCEAAGDIQLWIYGCPAQAEVYLHVYND